MDIVIVQGEVLTPVTLVSLVLACQESQFASFKRDFLNRMIFDAVIGRGCHLVLGRHVEPELDAQHPVGVR